MRLSHRLFCALIACLPLPAPAFAQSDDVRVARIVANLSPNMVKEGAPIHGQTLAEAMAKYHVPGVSIAFIHKGKVAWSRNFGSVSLGGRPVTDTTLFQAGSISKPVSATAALHLVQQGNLSLDANVNGVLTTWKLPPPTDGGGKFVTLRELLNHTATISVHGFPGYAAGTAVPSLTQILDGQPPATNPPIRIEGIPGQQWDYSGGGYLIVQQMILDVMNRPFADVMRDIVLRPYGMRHSTFEQPLPADLRDQAAVPYDWDGTPIQGGAHTYPELTAAGLWTTASDLARFMISTQKAIANGNSVLSAATAREMVEPGLGDWGLGFEIGGQPGHRYFWHGGGNAGYQSIAIAYEGTGDGAVVMTNGMGGYDLANDVIRTISREYKWPDWQPRTVHVVRVDPTILRKYVGTYQVDPKFSFSVTLRDGALFIQGSNQQAMELWPMSDRRFTFVVDVDVEFQRGANGEVVSMDLIQNGKTIHAPRQ